MSIVQIKWKIADDIKNLSDISAHQFDTDFGHISGFIQIRIGDKTVGDLYIPDADTLRGSEWIDYWVRQLLYVLVELKEYRKRSVAIKELETMRRWIEFLRDEETVQIHIAVPLVDSVKNLRAINSTDSFQHITDTPCIVSYQALCTQILSFSELFLNEVATINPRLMETIMVRRITEIYKLAYNL